MLFVSPIYSKRLEALESVAARIFEFDSCGNCSWP